MLQLTIFTGPPLSGKTYRAQQAIKTAEDQSEPIFFEGINSMEGFELFAHLLSNNKVAFLNNTSSPGAFQMNVHDLQNVHFYATTLLPVKSFKHLFENNSLVKIIECNYQPPKMQAL